MSSRRTSVNNMDRRSNNRALSNSEPNPKDYCPSCSVRLKYSSRLNDFFCSQCGFVRNQGERISFIVDGPNPPDNNKRKGPLTSASSGSSAAAADVNNNNIFIRPITKSRSQQSLEDSRRRHLQGYDNDMKRLEMMGYNIVDSYEHITTDNSTYDSNEARGSFSNLQCNRRMYFR